MAHFLDTEGNKMGSILKISMYQLAQINIAQMKGKDYNDPLMADLSPISIVLIKLQKPVQVLYGDSKTNKIMRLISIRLKTALC